MADNRQRGTDGVAYLWRAARNPPADPQTSFDGQTVLITGANSGLGFEAAVKFVNLGVSRLIISVRSAAKGQVTKEAILKRTGATNCAIHVLELDYTSYESIRAFAQKLETTFDTLDVAVLNAGVARPAYGTSQYGWELSIQINVISTAMLALLLMPKLRSTSVETGRPSILELVSSSAYLDVKPDTMELGAGKEILRFWSEEANFNVDRQYHISKLLLTFVQRGLIQTQNYTTQQVSAMGSEENEPIIMACCPGMCRTSLGREFGIGLRAFMKVFQTVVARSAEEGSREIVSGPAQGAKAHGCFWSNDKLNEVAPLIPEDQFARLQAQTWEEVMAELKHAKPDIAI
ncbi:MAG: hypothetical protein Q9162_000529 [Coniocarpon cinnabarinum]